MDHCWRGRVGRCRFGYLTVVILMGLCSQKILPIADFQLPIIRSLLANDRSEINNRKWAMDWWTWHDLNVRPRPSQSRALVPLSYRSPMASGGERAALTATSAVTRLTAETDLKLVAFSPAGQLVFSLSRVFRDEMKSVGHTWRKARESNPTRTKPPQFSRLLDSLYCRAFQVFGKGARIRTEIDEVGTRLFTN